MKKNSIIALLIFVGTQFGFSQENELPDITLRNLSGENVNVKELPSEKPIVLSFWATWCMPCIKELNAISDVYEDWQDETGVTLYAVSIDDSKTVSRVNPLVNGKAWDYEVLLDTNNELKRSLNIPTVPHVIVVKDGKIVYRHTGYQPGGEEKLYDEILEVSK